MIAITLRCLRPDHIDVYDDHVLQSDYLALVELFKNATGYSPDEYQRMMTDVRSEK